MKEQDIILQTVVKVMGMLRSGRINTYTRNIDIVRLIIKERKKVSWDKETGLYITNGENFGFSRFIFKNTLICSRKELK
jgi:hypothetical protein